MINKRRAIALMNERIVNALYDKLVMKHLSLHVQGKIAQDGANQELVMVRLQVQGELLGENLP